MKSLIQQRASTGYEFELLVKTGKVVEPAFIADLLNVHPVLDQ